MADDTLPPGVNVLACRVIAGLMTMAGKADSSDWCRKPDFLGRCAARLEEMMKDPKVGCDNLEPRIFKVARNRQLVVTCKTKVSGVAFFPQYLTFFYRRTNLPQIGRCKRLVLGLVVVPGYLHDDAVFSFVKAAERSSLYRNAAPSSCSSSLSRSDHRVPVISLLPNFSPLLLQRPVCASWTSCRHAIHINHMLQYHDIFSNE